MKFMRSLMILFALFLFFCFNIISAQSIGKFPNYFVPVGPSFSLIPNDGALNGADFSVVNIFKSTVALGGYGDIFAGTGGRYKYSAGPELVFVGMMSPNFPIMLGFDGGITRYDDGETVRTGGALRVFAPVTVFIPFFRYNYYSDHTHNSELGIMIKFPINLIF